MICGREDDCKMCLLLPSENYTHFSHSRCKLKEISWRDTNHGLDGIRPGSHEVEGLSEFMEQKHPNCVEKKELKVTTELSVMNGRLNESDTYLLEWTQQRKDSIHVQLTEPMS